MHITSVSNCCCSAQGDAIFHADAAGACCREALQGCADGGGCGTILKGGTGGEGFCGARLQK